MSDLVCIVDDDAPLRSAIARLLTLRGYDVTEYNSSDSFLEGLCDGVNPSCAILDVRLPGLNGLGLQQQLSQRGSPFPIIFLTGYGDVPMTVRVIKAGAEDVLTKPVPEQVLSEAVGRAVAKFHQDRSTREWRKGALTLLDSLTPREREVFQYVVRGKVNKQAAYELGITERTVKAHRHQIFEKLHAKTVPELVSLAEQLGMLPHPMPEPWADTDR